jgi:carboxylate-amine ligase
MLDRVIDDTTADARELGCVAEIDRCRTIAGAGTSADAQLAVFEAHREQDGHDEALRAVSDWLAVATMQ